MQIGTSDSFNLGDDDFDPVELNQASTASSEAGSGVTEINHSEIVNQSVQVDMATKPPRQEVAEDSEGVANRNVQILSSEAHILVNASPLIRESLNQNLQSANGDLAVVHGAFEF